MAGEHGAGEQATAATWHDQDVEHRVLGEQLTYRRRLPLDDPRVVERMQKIEAVLVGEVASQPLAIIEMSTEAPDAAAQALDTRDFEARRRLGHKNQAAPTELTRAEGDTLAEVARRRRHDEAARGFVGGERGEGAAHFERTGLLEVLRLQQAGRADVSIELAATQDGRLVDQTGEAAGDVV